MAYLRNDLIKKKATDAGIYQSFTFHFGDLAELAPLGRNSSLTFTSPVPDLAELLRPPLFKPVEEDPMPIYFHGLQKQGE